MDGDSSDGKGQAKGKEKGRRKASGGRWGGKWGLHHDRLIFLCLAPPWQIPTRPLRQFWAMGFERPNDPPGAWCFVMALQSEAACVGDDLWGACCVPLHAVFCFMWVACCIRHQG